MNKKIKYQGRLFQVIDREQQCFIDINGKKFQKKINYECVCRPPGTRALVIRDGKILLNHEFRYELNCWDYRLPGGKVYDTFTEYMTALNRSTINSDIIRKMLQESLEESYIVVNGYRFLNVAHAGLTVEWDLYYFLVNDFIVKPNYSIQKSEFEFIEPQWFNYTEALKLCLDGNVSKTRSAFEIMRYIINEDSSILR